MQGRGGLSKGKKIFLVAACVGAISSMMIAPEGAVGDMLARMTGQMDMADELRLNEPRALPPLPFINSDTKGKVVVLNFWALWCGPCKIEKPKLNALQGDYAGKGLMVLAVADGGDDVEAIKDYFAAHNLTHLKPMHDEGGVAFHTLELRGIPSTVVLNKKGLVVASAEGPVDWGNPRVRQFLDSLLKE